MKLKNLDPKKLLFAKIAWMREYKGNDGGRDRPVGGGKYVKDTGSAAEDKNFKPYGNQYYGYVPPNNGKFMKLDIQKHFGASKGESKISGITVIWVAPFPYGKGARVVGWYRNATVFSEIQTLQKRKMYQTQSSVEDCHLLSEGARDLRLPDNFRRPRMYGDADTLKSEKAFLSKLDKLVEKMPRRTKADVEKRKKVEISAIDCVSKHYQHENWHVKSVEEDNCGWDLTISNEVDELHVEVKGHQGNRINCELTPNEYKRAKRKNHAYMLAVVTDALSKKPCLRIFKPVYEHGKELKWDCIVGIGKVKTEEKIGAVISEK
ncbi:DUF3883 domain-containing protein [Candidatus Spongiihabitans sp.]|uniref:DUF3883 domain-containing protein n=1 Tax=Candidatus Spongiihabitans sp. TaxID=3101308 RepID=UPI003C6F1536